MREAKPTLDRLMWEVLLLEMPFVPKPKKRGAGQVKIEEGSITGRENTTYKGPKEGKYFLCMKNLKSSFVFRAE